MVSILFNNSFLNYKNPIVLKSVKHKCSNAVSSSLINLSNLFSILLAAGYIEQAIQNRDQMREELDYLQEEKEKLQQQITQYQSSLPVDGIPVMPAARRSREVGNSLFQTYISDRTAKNWRFYPYSLILKPLFDAYQNTVTCDSSEEFLRTLTEWKNHSLAMIQLRQAASQAVMDIGRTTSFINGKGNSMKGEYSIFCFPPLQHLNVFQKNVFVLRTVISSNRENYGAIFHTFCT